MQTSAIVFCLGSKNTEVVAGFIRRGKVESRKSEWTFYINNGGMWKSWEARDQYEGWVSFGWWRSWKAGDKRWPTQIRKLIMVRR